VPTKTAPAHGSLLGASLGASLGGVSPPRRISGATASHAPGAPPLYQVKAIGGSSPRAGISHVTTSHRGKDRRLMPELRARTRRRGAAFRAAAPSHSSWTFSAMNARFAVCDAQLPSWHVPKSRQRLRFIHSRWYGRCAAGPSHRSHFRFAGAGSVPFGDALRSAPPPVFQMCTSLTRPIVPSRRSSRARRNGPLAVP